MSKKYKFIYLLIVILISNILFSSCKSSKPKSLLVYCGAGLKKTMDEIGQKYTNKTGIKINYIYNGSGALLNQIKTTKKGDIIIPGDKFYINKLKNVQGESMIYTDKIIAYHNPVVIVSKQKNKLIKNFSDITKEEVKIVLGDESIAVGRLTKEIFEKAGIQKEINKNTIAKFSTVNQIALAVSMNEADVGIAWYSNYLEYKDKLSIIKIPENITKKQEISIGVLKDSKDISTSIDFMNFIIKENMDVFKSNGYEIKK